MAEDGLGLIFLRKEPVFVPTMARTKAGFNMRIEPVNLADAHDRAAPEQAILRVVKRGNPSVRKPSRAKFPKNLLLKYAKMKSISTFDKLAKSSKLATRDGAFLVFGSKTVGALKQAY